MYTQTKSQTNQVFKLNKFKDLFASIFWPKSGKERENNGNLGASEWQYEPAEVAQGHPRDDVKFCFRSVLLVAPRGSNWCSFVFPSDQRIWDESYTAAL